VKSVFISHSTKDDKVVAEIRGALQGKLIVWDDSQWMVGGDPLGRTIEAAIGESPYFMALLSLHAVNSSWVRDEIRYALKAGKRIIPVLLPGIEPEALGLWFDSKPLGVKYTTLEASLPALEASWS
jgi:hypothetical protein